MSKLLDVMWEIYLPIVKSCCNFLLNIYVNVGIVKQVDGYKYLASFITTDGRWLSENRTKFAWQSNLF